ncbi:Flp pilus assembly protein CpaB [Lichenihabitans sp. Uapishka_5]|uniref:Flp pilus assembly protein CpaB n=1 Tax=Lichenihabitans sp. Uapishka_5 TaxID=3037302 RepID=UPI0029E81F93|nr:Flp pilus assembly protein CpaB [Lichenihabitans sp. Uapishka_5]MDX7952764.1 Flp pilus assembly protein CpaB [Lichenihabitans sp. Uapishka_5]
MNPIRIAVLVLGVAAAGGAVMLALSPKPQAPAPVAAAAPPPVAAPVDQILVATHELQLGKLVSADDLGWQTWPKASITAFMIQHDDKVVAELTGSIARVNFYAGEPIRRESLIKGATAGFLSAVLPSGMRAVAITIDAQGSTSAGGFVLPNDRVDVIRTVKGSGTAMAESYNSETLLTNVKVLAIGQNIQDKNGAPTQVGSTATLELDPVQAETVILAQRTGQLSLALRSMQDAAQTGHVAIADGKTTVIRYGIETDAGTH